MSLSRFTRSPGLRMPSVVAAAVCGMTATVKLRLVHWKTVRLMPSTATDPFSTRYRFRSVGTEKRTRRLSPSSVTAMTRPTPST